MPPIPGGIPPMPPIPPGGPDGPPDLLEAMTSSILRIMHAASVADLIICSLTTSGSTISSFDMSATLPFLARSEEHTSELQSLTNLVCRLLLEKKKKTKAYNQSELNNISTRT